MITEQRKKAIIVLAESDWMDDFRIGQVKLLNLKTTDIFGLKNKEELKLYVDAYNAMIN